MRINIHKNFHGTVKVEKAACFCSCFNVKETLSLEWAVTENTA